MSHDSDVDETNCESSQLNRSEEIIVVSNWVIVDSIDLIVLKNYSVQFQTSDVYMQGDDDCSDSDDIPLKVILNQLKQLEVISRMVSLPDDENRRQFQKA